MMHSTCRESQLLTGEHTCRVNVLQQSCRPWGAAPYTAPEVNLGDDGYGPAVDMWAVGCVLKELVYGRVSFKGNTSLDVVNSVFARFDTPKPPRVLTTLPVYSKTSSTKIMQNLRPPRNRITTMSRISSMRFLSHAHSDR